MSWAMAPQCICPLQTRHVARDNILAEFVYSRHQQQGSERVLQGTTIGWANNISLPDAGGELRAGRSRQPVTDSPTCGHGGPTELKPGFSLLPDSFGVAILSLGPFGSTSIDTVLQWALRCSNNLHASDTVSITV